MKEASAAERKLELLHQVRSQYQQNQQDLMRREYLLYGEASNSFPREGAHISTEKCTSKTGKRIRWAFALLSVLFIILWDQNNLTVGGRKSTEFFQLLAIDYQESLAVWANELIVNVQKTDR